MLNQTWVVGGRVLRQLANDRRFLALSMIVPIALMYVLDVFFEAANRPFFDPAGFVPPVAAFIVHFLTYVLCAIVLVRERTSQTLTRMFVSGYRRAGVIGGYVLAYSLIATVQSLIVLVALNALFDLDYTLETSAAMYGVIWLLAVISIALGIFVSNFARNEGQVLPMIPLVLVPSLFFSGMIVSLDKMPDWANWLSWATPMYYANNAIQAILESSPVLSHTLALLAYGCGVMLLAVLTLRERV